MIINKVMYLLLKYLVYMSVTIRKVLDILLIEIDRLKSFTKNCKSNIFENTSMVYNYKCT